MVRLFAVDTAALESDFEALSARVDAGRRARVLRYGNTAAGRQCLGAGLLLTRLADAQTLSARLYQEPHGKPGLSGNAPFNLSHTDGFAVLATAEQPVGVDVERLRPVAAEALAARFFHPDEQAYLRKSADPTIDFFTLWTLKESYLKAEGCGFSRSLNSFAVLPDGAGGAVANWSTGYRFRCYNDALPGCRIAVCSCDAQFCDKVELVAF